MSTFWAKMYAISVKMSTSCKHAAYIFRQSKVYILSTSTARVCACEVEKKSNVKKKASTVELKPCHCRFRNLCPSVAHRQPSDACRGSPP